MDSEWKEVSTERAIRDAGVVAAHVDEREIALYAVSGAIYATENRCTHGEARLSDGFLLDDEIECPLHQGRFNVRDGRPMCAPLIHGVRVFPVKVDLGRVFVLMPRGVENAASMPAKREPCTGACHNGVPQ